MTLYTTKEELDKSRMKAEYGKPETFARLWDDKGNVVKLVPVFDYKVRDGSATIETWDGEDVLAEIDDN
jgi:hypothetical protein